MRDKTVKELIIELNHKKRSISDIALYYLENIKSYDPYLNSISEINPDIDKIIQDLELNNKKSMLHGIPIIIKDNIQTADQMHTTANSYALKDFKAPFDATIVKKIRDAGMLLM